ncbi:helix-hairpin-helix domain-containing protein [Sulfurimonas sp. HSL-1716]|uniref:ComEA family DNA-binding protein n=1 Tax=Hydrocurvibacter sulfurireducens TaxID=3131937 RepID=UPI0031F81D4B
MKVFVIVAILAGLLFGAVDINTAGKDELMSLKGIGIKKADAILKYRKTHCFKSIEDLTIVKGIGPKFIEKNKKALSASVCKN